METVKADAKQRVRLPDVKPGQVFAFTDNGDGTITLTRVKAERKEPFPPGSLAKYFTRERDKDELQILKGCASGPLANE